jgi:hypothetical protein
MSLCVCTTRVQYLAAMISSVSFLLLLASGVGAAVISQLCNLVCSAQEVTCMSACSYNLSQAQLPFFGAPWLRLRARFDMGKLHKTITGSSSPLTGERTNVYFTSLDGKLYQYRNESQSQTVIFELPPSYKLNTSNGKGLYDVSFHRKFQQNGVFYLHFSIDADPGTTLTLTSKIRSINGQNQLYQFPVDHYNVVFKYRKFDTAVVELGEVTRFSQLTPDRSGGWMASAIPEGWNWYNEDPLYVAIGGNSEENILYGSELSYLSTIRRLDAEKPQSSESTWASGASNPLSCSNTVHKAGEIMCLVQLYDSSRALFRIRKGTNIGKPEYVMRCEESGGCRAGRLRNDTAPLEIFYQGDRCPVTSVMFYTGYKMNKFRGNLFLSRDACYLKRLGRIEPAELLRLVRNSTSGDWYTSPVPTDFEDSFLVDTKLVGADNHDDFFLSGFSMRSGKQIFYSINPIRAANDYLEDDYDENGVIVKKAERARR